MNADRYSAEWQAERDRELNEIFAEMNLPDQSPEEIAAQVAAERAARFADMNAEMALFKVAVMLQSEPLNVNQDAQRVVAYINEWYAAHRTR